MPSVAEIHEVMQKGGAQSGCRTADQTAAAIFWALAPLETWWRAVLAVVAASDPSRKARDRRVAMAASAMAAAQKAAARMARRTRSPRPAALIRGEAPSRLWPRTTRSAWIPLVEPPPTPEFPCEACVAGGAAVAVLRSLLGGDGPEVVVAHPHAGLVRTFSTLSHMLQESEDARVWAGWHFRSTAVESTEIGLQLRA